MIHCTYPQTEYEPAEYASTRPAICRLDGLEYDLDEEANSLDRTCCKDHEQCTTKGCQRLQHPLSQGEYCAVCELDGYLKELKEAWMHNPPDPKETAAMEIEVRVWMESAKGER